MYEVCGNGTVSLHERTGVRLQIKWSTVKSHRYFDLVKPSQNHLRVRADGDDIFLFLNGRLVIEQQADYPKRGNIGVYVKVHDLLTANQTAEEFTVRAPSHVDQTVGALERDRWSVLHDANYFNSNRSWIESNRSDTENSFFEKSYSNGKRRSLEKVCKWPGLFFVEEHLVPGELLIF